MLSLTRQEKYILLFLAAFMLISLGANYFKKGGEGADKYCRERLPPERRLININTANIGELIGIRGIGPKTAERIVEYRDLNGPFFYVEDIKKIKGIGPKKFNRIKEWIAID